MVHEAQCAAPAPAGGAPAAASRLPRSLPGVVALFALSRVFYLAQGVQFDDSFLRIAWNLLDVQLLRDDLLRSVWHLHSQPPLFNLLCGLLVKAFPETPTLPLLPLFTLLGLLNLLAMDSILRGLGVRPILRWSVLALCAFNPSFILIENCFFYTQPLTCMMTFSVWAWMRMMPERRLGFAAILFALLFSIAMIRSLFHLAWYVVLAGTAIALWGKGRRSVALIAAIPGSLIFLWYLKTWIMFGAFTSSTWMGMSLAKNTTFRLSQEERAALVKSGELTPMANIIPFSRYVQYRDHMKAAKTGIPALDQLYKSSGSINYNNLAMIDLCRMYAKDAKWTLRHRPRVYLESQLDAWGVYFQPTSHYTALNDNRSRVMYMEDLYNSLVYHEIESPTRKNTRPGTFFSFYIPFDRRIFSPTLAVMFLVSALWLPWRAARLIRSPETFAAGSTLLFVWLNVCYVSFMGNLMETGENNRFRFMIEPATWIVFALFVQSAAEWVAQRVRARGYS